MKQYLGIEARKHTMQKKFNQQANDKTTIGSPTKTIAALLNHYKIEHLKETLEVSRQHCMAFPIH